MSSIHADAFLPHPPEKVWRALTDSRVLATWLMPNDFVPRLGHRFTFRTEPVPAHGFDSVVRCEVLAIDPPELLRISWAAGERLDTTVTWRLSAEGGGTRLSLVHEGFDDNDPGQRATRQVLGGGWRGQLARRLVRALSNLPAVGQPAASG